MTSFAIVFAGQGSQSVGMMDGFATRAEVKNTFAEASEVLGFDLWQLAANGPTDAQNLTINTQPLMLAAGVATYRVWRAAGGSVPHWAAGHSLGEYTALVAAGALSFSDAVGLVRYRAQCMQDAVPEGVGGMAALLGLEVEAVIAVCAEAAQGEVLAAANLNAPGQVVIAGTKAAVERGMALAKARGAKRAIPLAMSVPSHCALMQTAAKQLAARLEGIALQHCEFPVVQNAEVTAFSQSGDVKSALVRQLASPVRWIETVQHLAKNGVSHVMECTPGKVLTGLNKRIDANLVCLPVHDEATLAAAIAAKGA